MATGQDAWTCDDHVIETDWTRRRHYIQVLRVVYLLLQAARGTCVELSNNTTYVASLERIDDGDCTINNSLKGLSWIAFDLFKDLPVALAYDLVI